MSSSSLCVLVLFCCFALSFSQPPKPQISTRFESDVDLVQEYNKQVFKFGGHVWYNYPEVKGRADGYDQNGDDVFTLTRGDLGFVFNRINLGNCTVAPFDPNNFQDGFEFLQNCTYGGQEVINNKICDKWVFNSAPVTRTIWIVTNTNTPALEKTLISLGSSVATTTVTYMNFTPVSRFSPDAFSVPKDCPSSSSLLSNNVKITHNAHFLASPWMGHK
eukprot:TRINITY_DN2485_c0_g1_i2.p1 TRINITY_DN2485_c0_g1~~TRINITY_DN2485_c0_g1_i2.p1  ORF type:complete len:218 (+),score=51.67 TRINITY_DN2485_c0_g1_i2:91-744(+)